MCCIAILVSSADVAKTEHVKTRVISNLSVDRTEREENSPGYEPDGQHKADHHA